MIPTPGFIIRRQKWGANKTKLAIWGVGSKKEGVGIKF
jgi:hypothetical protein